ncbi:hypothetical protein ES150_19005 [Enterobacillus tribolii]|nr:hypothetical protein [Enterobacillus tribolii]
MGGGQWLKGYPADWLSRRGVIEISYRHDADFPELKLRGSQLAQNGFVAGTPVKIQLAHQMIWVTSVPDEQL